VSDEDERVPIEELEDPARTPPLEMPGRNALRALAIVLAFTVAGSLVWILLTESGRGFTVSWTQYLSAPGLLVGLAAAAGDYAWRHLRDRG